MTEAGGNPAVYVDANPFIYLIEGGDDIASIMRELFDLLRAKPQLAATSELTIAEVLVKARSPIHRRSYLDLIVWSRSISLIPVSRDLLIETADYRRVSTSSGSSTPKLPDAIHAVTAVRSGCRFFLSNDTRIKLPAEIRQFAPTPHDTAALMKELR
ncbi:type II toxin-antitoxin system VapC family toxin [Xanthobacteraceae bacterium Astr-EGSB]|uniref:type II toxin-antitoxin system VapC family toxin n=1 Tax=Astrobacterium formosum TaxID=3069710 RepID=UPI0027B625ED|nr:type II toxin-antitoxin system VapC family toxin [Xanthobacteraceae bacterium Astr-EGSB]